MTSATEVFQPLQADDPPSVAGYRLAARLGAGGMGRVYLSHTQGGRPVAIKVVRPELAEDPEFRRRFRREVEAARRVRGAYTAELIDAEADGTPPWLATLYVPGPSLSEAVARRGPLPVPAVLWLVAGVAEALQVIHDAGIVHRDLKPSNVLLAADGPRVIDFGISLASGTTAATATGSAIGTPQYMAPEQAEAGEVTTATDVFALGQTGAFAALGEPLYGSGPSVSVLFRIVHSAPDLSRLPEELRPLIARCLAADPQERATPAEIVAWCRRHLPGDADDGPAVWREVAGPEVSVPAPVPNPTALNTFPLVWAPPQQPQPQQRRPRGRRTALIAAAAVTAGALLVTGVVWAVKGAADLRDGQASKSTQGTPSASVSASASGSGSASAGSAAAGSTPQSSAPASASPQPPKPPTPVPYPGLNLEEYNSIGIQEPVLRATRTGDVRLKCDKLSCELESDSSLITMLRSKPGATLDTCVKALQHADAKSAPLSLAAQGSEFCVKHPSGDIGLIVLQIKQAAPLDTGRKWLTVDLTVWRAA
ncbi:serine/threonine protein kinase (plasmid) [Streptomyces sp. NBC_01351]|uniref:serine/threonine-protein kinase n=1 Tax=Streptomyces sp. NBC_01351 TaxID=2903833 RepID=UPI002E323A90|nr:serine/threonine-protein kinase [Streptomyces sp. NBC_01351]